MGIVESIFSRKRSRREEAELAAAAIMPREPAVTKLIMLMPDASGIATYQLHTFIAASQAEAYLVSILRGDIQEGTIMFWGLTWLPSDNGNQDVEVEPVVLIRDPKRPGLVYTFSFVDLDSAYDFVRHEMKAGLDLAQTAIFWAVPAEATADYWGEITVTPSRPPTRALDHDEPNAADEPARKTADGADISRVINILEARGLRAASSPPQSNDQPEGSEDMADEPSDAGNGVAHVGDETIHIDLSDVFGGRRDPEALPALSDFRRRREGWETNGVDAASEGVFEAPAETVSGVVAAWSNIGAAIDEAIDAYVARRVGATISWRRLSRAFAAATNIRMLVTWRAIAQALYAGAAVCAARKRALAEAWRNAARALRLAADSKSGRRAKRLAWANISWTLEEAVYAARLQQKKHHVAGRAAASTATTLARKNTKAESTKGGTNVKKAAKTTKTTRNVRSEAKEAPKPDAERRSAADARAAAMEMWRFRESGRFSEKKGPFDSFESPPGRF